MSSVDTEVTQFGIDIEIAERKALGEDASDLVDLWCMLGLTEYSGEQLLERICRHVRAVQKPNRMRRFHLRSLERLADEIERRLQSDAEAEYESS